MKKTLIFCTFVISLTAVQSRMRPPPKYSPKSEPYIPKDLRKKTHGVSSNLRIPNKQFCAERPLNSAEHYLVLPWWYHYCQHFIEKRNKKNDYLLPYKNILEKLKIYKKSKIIEEQRFVRQQQIRRDLLGNS